MSVLAALAAVPLPVGQEWFEARMSPGAGRAAYLAVAGGVLFGSILPVVPTGAIVGAAAAAATTTEVLSLPLVLLLAGTAALAGDLVTFAAARRGSGLVLRVVGGGRPGGARGGERLARMRDAYAARGWLLVLVGRVAPAARVPTLLAAAASGMAWVVLVPAVTGGAVLWTLFYGVLGVLTGHLTDSPLVAALAAVLLAALVGGGAALVRRLRAGLRARRRPAGG